MESTKTRQLLAVILQASAGQFKTIKALNAICQEDHGHAMSPSLILTICEIRALDQLDNLSLAKNNEREEKIQDFLFKITPSGIEWIEAVKETAWDTFNWSSEATQHFTRSESLGIPGTVAFAVVSAAMTLQIFPVPRDLNTRLYGAKKTIQQQVLALVAAEKRREAELKGQPQQ